MAAADNIADIPCAPPLEPPEALDRSASSRNNDIYCATTITKPLCCGSGRDCEF